MQSPDGGDPRGGEEPGACHEEGSEVPPLAAQHDALDGEPDGVCAG